MLSPVIAALWIVEEGIGLRRGVEEEAVLAAVGQLVISHGDAVVVDSQELREDEVRNDRVGSSV